MREVYNLRRSYYFILAFLLGGFFLFIAIGIVKSIDYLNSDFFSYWLAGRMVWTGQNQYSAVDWIQGHTRFGATWISDTRFLYPLPLAWFFVPLGLLPLHTAYIIWVFLLESMIVLSASILIFQRKNPKRKYYVIPILAAIVIFRPTFLTLLNGQISGLLLFILTCVIVLWENEKWLLGSLLLTLIALKPNIGVPIIIILSFWLLVQKRVLAFIGMVMAGLILILAGMMLNINWLIGYFSVGSTKMSETFGYSPTLWGLAAYMTKFSRLSAIALGGIVVTILLIGVFCFIWQKRSVLAPVWIISIAITTALLITPYTWPYDQLLLIIPIITIMMEMVSREYSFLLTSMVFILVDIVAILLLGLSDPMQLAIFSAFIPLIVFCALIFFTATIKINPTNKSQIQNEDYLLT